MEYIIYTATIPSALTGVDIVVFASSFAYISDISSTDNRTLRITILELSYLVTFPTGIALGMYSLVVHLGLSQYSDSHRNKTFTLFTYFLGSYLFNHVVGKSYSIMFSINAAFVVAAILYSAFCLKVINKNYFTFLHF